MYIAYSSASSCPRLLLLGTEEGTKYMDSDAPRLSSDFRHLQIMTCSIAENRKVMP
jgi:hypothetical protein